jgi:SAM-dependent methyltransferase
MSPSEWIHAWYIHDRRSRVLSHHLSTVIPKNFSLLDVGCGDGLLSQRIARNRPDISLSGIDVLVREHHHIPIHEFDGQMIPYEDRSFDGVMFIDVLHHTADPMILLREALRVARHALLVKDHTRDGLLAGPTLRLMDRVGNARHGVSLPHNYWPKRDWLEAFDSLGLRIGVWTTNLRLYPWPVSLAFDRSLHFVARLEIE